ncbi:MAG TPA: tRNA (adenosine(37)-N6)-threonylcarbamoyltransferase complex transferase subunit TsaD [Actinomycetota bacterium]|nr:tRNA (adenosine(37)-N6)-threonylcarbamoyltransferase complex transferase subunit TsaD [Actinomycetota bacterium]
MTEPLVGPDAVVLGIETSCDETAVGVVRGGKEVLSNVIASQADLHERFGGVVPEIAARAHVEHMQPVVDKALRDAKVTLRELDAVAATRGPGLIGALLVGYATGKAMAAALGVPFCGVHHLEGHVFAGVLDPGLEPPFVALIVSGGHTSLFRVDELGSYVVLGETLDDAAGEAFDKIARFLGLGYPGGPAIDRIAKRGKADAIAFPRALSGQGLDFSFSGLKTAVVRHVRRVEEAGRRPVRSDVAASFQEAIVDVQVEKALRAAEEAGVSTIAAGGGVAANTRLRARLSEEAAARGLAFVVPAPGLCVDNGAMIAAAAHFRLRRGESTPLDAPASASLELR